MSENKTKLVMGGLYEHYKGKRYRVHGIVRHSETLEELVLYETLYENALGKMWVRPKEMFFETIELKNCTTFSTYQVNERTIYDRPYRSHGF